MLKQDCSNPPPPPHPPKKHGKRWLVLALLLPASLVLSTGFLPAHAAEPAVTIPWAEFQQLYATQLRPQRETPAPARFNIRQAHYAFNQKDTHTATKMTGSVKITGRWLTGTPQPISLFSNGLAITAINQIEGGHLVSTQGNHQFLSNGAGDFLLDLSLAIMPNKNGEYLFDIPPALSNRLTVNSQKTLKVKSDGLIKLGDSEFTFASRNQLKFTLSSPTPPAPLAIDIVSQFSIIAERLQQQTWLISDSKQRDVRLTFDPNLTWIKNIAGHVTAPGELTLKSVPANTPIKLVFERSWKEKAVDLPTIEANRGEQGLYTLAAPLAGELSATNTRNHSLSAVPSQLKAALPQTSRLQQIKKGALQLQFRPFKAVEQPPLIVDNIGFFSSYTNDGRQLSTLRLSVPMDYGKQLTLPPVTDAEVWSLTVNGLNTPLFSNSDSGWVVPLTGKRDALIELTWVQQHQRPGLQGQFPLSIPPLGLAARSLSIVLALPSRLELLSMEGDLSPAAAFSVPRSVPLHGAPRFFSQPFYRGEAITAALFYREPVETHEHLGSAGMAVEKVYAAATDTKARTPWVIE